MPFIHCSICTSLHSSSLKKTKENKILKALGLSSLSSKVRTLCFYCWGLGSILGRGTKKDPRAVQCGKKKKLKWQEYTEELYQKDLNDLDNHDGNAKKCSNYCTIALISHDSKVMLKILQASLQQCVNLELSDVQARFRKGRGTRDQIANICWIIEKAREF